MNPDDIIKMLKRSLNGVHDDVLGADIGIVSFITDPAEGEGPPVEQYVELHAIHGGEGQLTDVFQITIRKR